MKIPLYTSGSQMTRETPGRSISARMSMAGPRAIAEQGKVLQTAIQEVGSFAEMKYKMLDETERNEAIFGAKEQIRDTAYRMKRGKDNRVLEGDNSPWDQEMTAIRDGLLNDFHGSRNSRFMFEQEFKIAASNAKFSLQETIHDRIEVRNAASKTALKRQIVEIYGDPDMDLESLNSELASFEQMLKRSANNLLINPELVEQIGAGVLPDVAEQLVMGWAGTDVDRVTSLNEALTAFEALGSTADNAKTSELSTKAELEFMEIAGAGGNYTLQVLMSIQPGDANAILAKALNQASKFLKGENEVQKAAIKYEKESAERMYTLAISDRLKPGENITLSNLKTFYNPAEGYSPELLRSLGGVEMANGDFALKGPKVQTFLQEVLRANKFFQTNATMSQGLEKAITESTSVTSYASFDNAATLEAIDSAFRNGFMKIQMLEDSKEKLTRTTYNQFLDRIEEDQKADKSELTANVNTYFQEIGNRLGAQIDENTTGNAALGISKGAVKDVVGTIRTEIRERQQAGTPMTFNDITTFGENLLVTVEKEKITKLKRQFKIEFMNSLDSPTSDLALNLNDPQVAANPRAALDDIFDNLASNLQSQYSANYLALLGVIGRYESQGTFD